MFHSQQRTFKSKFLILFALVLAIFWLPAIRARNLENSKNELRENEIGRLNTGANGKQNNQYNSGSPTAYYAPKRSIRPKLPQSWDFWLQDDYEDRAKRIIDDYGHMRFGKRGGEEQFDDYGHMRFGRSI